MRHCPTCNQDKEESCFYRNRHMASGYNNYCKSCWKRYEQDRRAKPENREKRLKQAREYNNRPEIRARLDAWCADNWASRIIHKSASHASQRSKSGKLGVTCSITREYVIELWEKQGGLCHYSGVAMSRQLYQLDSVSLDRVDSTVGYEPGNVVLTIKAINMAKGNHPDAEVFSLIDRIADSVIARRARKAAE